MDYPDLTGDQVKRIVNFLKFVFGFTMGAVVIIISVGLFVTYKDINQIRQRVDLTAEKAEKQLAEIKIQSRDEILNTRRYANEQIDNFQLRAVREAQLAATSRIEEIFSNSTRIEGLIENVAEQRVYDRINNLVESELNSQLDGISNRIRIIPSLISSIDRIRAGSRDAFKFIDSIRTSTDDFEIRKLAQEIYDLKSEDYRSTYPVEEVYQLYTMINSMPPNTRPAFTNSALQIEDDGSKWKMDERDDLIKTLKRVIENGDNLNTVATALQLLNIATTADIEFLNMEKYFATRDTIKKLDSLTISVLYEEK